MSTYAPFAKPLYVMLKPVGAVCNLACDYCYYLEKSKLYRDNPKHVMSEELLEKFIEEYINSQTMPQVLFTWHGGETLMRPLSFYKRAMELQKKYANGRTIDNCIQTNGTLLTDEWCRFFKENNRPLMGVANNIQNLKDNTLLSDYFVQNASFMKCDNITLGYSFKKLFGAPIGGRVYAAVQNVFTITKYKGLDPEVEKGLDNNIYPRPLTTLIGLSLNF